jgi:hypothetical protein
VILPFTHDASTSSMPLFPLLLGDICPEAGGYRKGCEAISLCLGFANSEGGMGGENPSTYGQARNL